jgi:hypothetical protein
VMASASGLRTPSYESTQLSTCESRAACFCYRFEVAEGGAALNYRVQQGHLGRLWCGLLREGGSERGVCESPTRQLCQLAPLPPNRRFGFAAFKPKP